MIKETFHADYNALPWAENWTGNPAIRLQMLMADIEAQRYAVRMQFDPGLVAPPHKHTGEVHAITLAGRWNYLEYADSPPSEPGSYLFEPPGTTHTLKIADDAEGITDVIFIIYGAMLHLDHRGEVIGITDAQSVIAEYVSKVGEKYPDIEVPIGGLMKSFKPSDPELQRLVTGGQLAS